MIGIGSAIPIVQELHPHITWIWAVCIGSLCGFAVAVAGAIGLAAGSRAFGWL